MEPNFLHCFFLFFSFCGIETTDVSEQVRWLNTLFAHKGVPEQSGRTCVTALHVHRLCKLISSTTGQRTRLRLV